MKKLLLICLFSSFTCSITSNSFSQTIAPSKSSIDTVLGEKLQFALDSTMAAYNIVGASASIFFSDSSIWNGVYGLSLPRLNDSIRSDMLFSIASCTKPYVASVVLKLAEEGLLSLDDSLHKWLPPYPNIDSTITIRQLLNHTSGVSDFWNDNFSNFWTDIGADYSAYWSPEKTLTYVLPPNFEPGTSGKYSNTGYILAGMIILKATGDTTFTQTLHDKILNPLNLTYTMVDVEEPLVADLAHGWYDLDNDGVRDDVFNQSRTALWSSTWTAAAILSTAEDLCSFTWHNYRGDLLNQTSMNEMLNFSPIKMFNNVFVEYGLGVAKEELLGENFYGHGGNMVWYTSYTVYSQKFDVAVTVLVNQDPYSFQFPNSGPRLAVIEILRVILNYYKYPYDKVHPFQIELLSKYIEPNQDSVRLTCKVNNPQNHGVRVNAILTNSDSSYIASTPLFDDGAHGDSLMGDMIFGGVFNPIIIEDDFTLSVSTFDEDLNYYHLLDNAGLFTTKGPISLESTEVTVGNVNPIPPERIKFSLTLKNSGVTDTVYDVYSNIILPDNPFIVNSTIGTPKFGNIAPGETLTSRSRDFALTFHDSCNPGLYEFGLEITSNNIVYWYDTFTIDVLTGIENVSANLPKEYALEQNYPNPFNPSTVIKYQIPNYKSQLNPNQSINQIAKGLTNVLLKVYDILGREVSTLVNEKQKPGYYKITWDASSHSSGIYFYQLTAGDFVKVKKMILLR